MKQETITIGPVANGISGSFVLPVVSASFFICFHSPKPFQARIDSGNTFKMATAKSFFGKKFSQLTLLNPNSVSIDVRIAYGDEQIPDQEPPRLCTNDTVAVPHLASTSIPGFFVQGDNFYRRESIRVINKTPANIFSVKGSASAIGDYNFETGILLGLAGNQPWYDAANPVYMTDTGEIKTDDTMVLLNATVADATAQVIQQWYLVA